jgi:nucleoside 2-deoxyribosyltransferase
MKEPTKLYLASPYSSDDKRTMEKRYQKANEQAAKLMKEGFIVFSPLSHSHPIAQCIPETQVDHEFWLRQDLPFLAWSDILFVLCLPGWEQSKGVLAEIDEAHRLNIPVHYEYLKEEKH